MSHWFLAVGAVAQRELTGIAHNRQLIFFCFILPILWLLVVWGLLGDGVMQHVPVALVDQDHSPQSRAALRAIAACRAVRFVPFQEPDAALGAMRGGEVYGVLLVPAGYGHRELQGSGGTLALWLDENRYAVAGVLASEITSAVRSLTAAKTSLQVLRLGASPTEARRLLNVVHDEFYVLGNLQTSFLAFLGSTLMPGLIMIGAMFAFVTAFLREWWHNSFGQWIVAARGHTGAAICGKLLPYYLGYAFIFLFYLALFLGASGNRAAGSLLLWLALGLACLAAFAGAAIVVAAIAPTWRMALVISAGYAAPALPFSGFSMPLDSMAFAVAAFGRCLPLTWYIQGQTQAWTLGADLAAMGTAFGGLACIAIATWIAGWQLMRLSANRHARREGRP